MDQDGRVVTPIDFTSTLSYINFLNHSEQAGVGAAIMLSTAALQQQDRRLSWRRALKDTVDTRQLENGSNPTMIASAILQNNDV